MISPGAHCAQDAGALDQASRHRLPRGRLRDGAGIARTRAHTPSPLPFAVMRAHARGGARPEGLGSDIARDGSAEFDAHRLAAQRPVGGHLAAVASSRYQHRRRLEEGVQRHQRVGLRARPGAIEVAHSAAYHARALDPAEEQVWLNVHLPLWCFLFTPAGVSWGSE